MIKAPFNFVPLLTTAYYPEWANHISQDIPFKDGVSGSIEYTIKAETPIFVRNGQSAEDNDTSFSNISGKYFIPGSSIKGEIRNVLEILSCGKMTQVQDSRFGIRDLSNSRDGQNYREKLNGVKCGWLYKEGGSYKLDDCGEPWRISPRAIDRKFNSGLENFVTTLNLGRNNEGNAQQQEEIARSAYTKYSLLNLLNNKENLFQLNHFKIIPNPDPNHNRNDNRKFADFAQNGSKGILVLTGQPSRRQQNRDTHRWQGKYYEFIFLEPRKKALPVNQDVIEDFLTIHKNNYDFLHLWKDRLFTGKKIPVFFLKDNNENIIAIGLAYMFRFPTANFIKGAIPVGLQSQRHKDMAECIFGTESQTLSPLKGRVYFSPAFAEGNPNALPEVTSTLSSPKPSYGPLYTKYGSWDNSDTKAVIKGRKRYPVRNNVWENEQGNDKTGCSFSPLPSGTIFKGCIHFHNLKMEEYGALIAALTFNNHPECFHSIGGGKPLGYGKVKLKIENTDVTSIEKNKIEYSYALNIFQNKMRQFFPQWDNSGFLKQLLKMATGIPVDREDDFKYLKMDTNPRKNEFKLAKDNGERLPLFTDIIDNTEANLDIPLTRRIKRQKELDMAIQIFDKNKSDR